MTKAMIAGLDNARLADALEMVLADCAPGHWAAYEVGTMQQQENNTVGHFGDWVVGSDAEGWPGGNYRDLDTGDDSAHARFIMCVKNHAPQIIAALRSSAVSSTDNCQRHPGDNSR